jgi:protein-disulfide isomerase
MASRKEQKEAARQARLAQERALAERARKQQRVRMLGGVVLIAVAIVVAAIAISSGGGSPAKAPAPQSPAAKKAASAVSTLLAGIQQSGNTLGSPSAKVTVTEYGDLVCPICKDFALGAESQLIANDVRKGKVKLVYKALETASGQANNSMFVSGQVAALAAGQQNLGWNYIELFYHEQGDETASYVTNGYLQGLAGQIPGLDYSKWSAARSSNTLASQVLADEQSATNAGFNSTPTIVVSGPKSQAQPIIGAASYSQLESRINSVS